MKSIEMLTLCGLLAVSGCTQAEAAADQAREWIASVTEDDEAEPEPESESEVVATASAVPTAVEPAAVEPKVDEPAAVEPKADEPVAEVPIVVTEPTKAEPAPETKTAPETAPETKPEPEPTVVLASTKSGPGCLAGTWTADSLPFVETSLRRQAHGRSVRSVGDASGTFDLTIDPTAGTIRVAVEHWRQRYAARLAGVKVSYRVDLHGSLEAPLTVGADGTVTLGRPDHRTLRASERVSFDGHSPRSRALGVPLRGELEFTCDGDTLTLDNPRSRGGKLTFSRARPGASS